jgi:hypothetical protein
MSDPTIVNHDCVTAGTPVSAEATKVNLTDFRDRLEDAASELLNATDDIVQRVQSAQDNLERLQHALAARPDADDLQSLVAAIDDKLTDIDLVALKISFLTVVNVDDIINDIVIT